MTHRCLVALTGTLSLILSPAAHAQTERGDNGGGERTLLIGGGGFVASNPYASAKDDVEVGAVPFFLYQQGRVTADPSGVGVSFAERGGYKLEALASARWQIVDPEDTEDFADLDRDLGADLGIRITAPVGPIAVQFVYLGDVSGKSEGHEVSVSGEYEISIHERLSLGLRGGAAWRDVNLSTWLYGIREKEAGPYPSYEFGETPGAAGDGVVVPSLGAQLTYRLSERTSIIVATEAEYFGADITHSPLVEDEYMVRSFAAFVRAF